jgi:ferredoxin
MKLAFDAGLCRGHGRCYYLAEDLLTEDDEGYVTARGQVVDVPADQVEDARNAAASCPERAITVLED